MASSLRVSTLLVLAVLAIIGSGSGVVDAHSGKQSYLYVSVYDDGVEGRVEMPAVQLADALDVEIPSDPASARAAIDDLTDPIRDYVAANTSLGDEEGPWKIDFAERLRVLPTESGLYVTIGLVVDETFDTVPETFVADFSVIIESDPEKDALLLIEDDWARAQFRNEGDHLASFSVGMTQQTVEPGDASTLQSMGEIRGLGTDAIRGGIDLMLIVVAVTLVGAMAVGASGRTLATSDLAKRGGVLFLALTAGQTPTLWLTGLGVISPDAGTVGVLVAGALLVAAVLAVTGRLRGLPERVLTLTVVAIGVVQGLGLGQLFLAAQLDRRRPALSLVAFQIGDIIAAAIVVACFVGPMLLLRRTRVATALCLAVGAALIGYSVAWLGERILSEDWPIEEVANPLRVWPRNLWVALLAIAAAALVRRFDRTLTSPEEPETT